MSWWPFCLPASRVDVELVVVELVVVTMRKKAVKWEFSARSQAFLAEGNLTKLSQRGGRRRPGGLYQFTTFKIHIDIYKANLFGGYFSGGQ